MPTYAVTVRATMLIEVEAENEHQAREKGLEEAEYLAEYPVTDIGPVLSVFELREDVPHGD